MAETKTKKKDEVAELKEQVEVLSVPLSVTRKLTVDDETKEYEQHEMGFLTKLKFMQLMSSTLRLATDGDQNDILAFVDDTLSPGNQNVGGGSFVSSMMKLIELVPDFYEEAVLLALKVPATERLWVLEALENIDDEEGVDIIDTFIAQNAKALQDFFSKHLKKLQARVQTEFNLDEDTEQESEDTA